MKTSELNNTFIRLVHLIALLAISAATHPVNVTFLKGVTRLNTPGFVDYYFSCSVVGRFLQWQYNSDPLTGFQISDPVGSSLVRKRNEYEYTGTLLSSEPINNNLRHMVSIIVISFQRNQHISFDMTCSNGSVTLPATAEPPTNVTKSSSSNSNDSVVLDYIITSPRVMHNMSTHIFLCGANFPNQQLTTNGRLLAFRASERLGVHKVASASTYTINEQGILMAHSPFRTTAILIVSDNSQIVVSCSYRTIRKVLQSQLVQEPSPSTTTPIASEPLSSSTPADKPSASRETDPFTAGEGKRETMPVIINGKSIPVKELVTGTFIATFTVAVAVGIIIAIILFYKCHTGMKATSKAMSGENKHWSRTYHETVVVFEEKLKEEVSRKSLLRLRKKSGDRKKMPPSVKPFSSLKKSFIFAFSPNQVQVDQETEVEESKVAQVDKGGSQFATYVAGKLWKKVYIHSDGETVEKPEKSNAIKQDRPDSFWSIIRTLLKGLFIKYSEIFKFDTLRGQRNGAKNVHQVQEGSDQLATISVGHEWKPVYIESDGETFTTTENDSGLSPKQIIDKSNYLLFVPANEATEGYRELPDGATQHNFRASRQISLTRGFS